MGARNRHEIITDDVGGRIAPDGSYFAGELNSIVTPDREYIVYLRADTEGELRLYAVDGGGTPVAVPGARRGEIPIAWDGASRALFVWDRCLPGDLIRLDLEDRAARGAASHRAARPRGRHLRPARHDDRARYYPVRFRRMLSSLTLVEGLR